MKGFWPVFRKELYGMFMSPIFYVVGFIFLLISAIFFELLLAQLVMVSFQVAEHPELMGEFSMMELLLRYFLGNLSCSHAFYCSSFNDEALRGGTQKRHNRTAVHLPCDRCCGRSRQICRLPDRICPFCLPRLFQVSSLWR